MRAIRITMAQVITYVVLGLVSFMVLFPIYWIITMSFKIRVDIITLPPKWIPYRITLENYRWVLSFTGFLKALKNSTIISVSSTLLALIIGVPAGYSFSRFRFKGRNSLYFWIITTRMTPPIGIIIPFYVIWIKLGLLDTYTSLIITYLVISLPLVIWLMKGFFDEIPPALEEAAMIDGCTPVSAFLRVALPLALPGLAATAIMSFILIWNEFFFALILTVRHAQTAPVVVATMVTHGLEFKWGELAAAGVICMLPAMAFMIVAQKYLVRGLTMGALRG